MGQDVNCASSLFGSLQTKSDIDSLRKRQNTLLEDLKDTGGKKQTDEDHVKKRKEIIVELTAVGKELGWKVYHEKYDRLENQRLKNEETTARTVRQRNRARRERENLLMRLSAEKLALADQGLVSCQAFGGGDVDHFDQDSFDKLCAFNDGINSDIRESREYMEEAGAVARRRHADEWKECEEEKAHKRKRCKINIMI